MSNTRDLDFGAVEEATGSSGRHMVAVIGIDRYRGWPRLTNAVGDARGAAALFGRLGFEQVAALLDNRATGNAIEGLVTDDLRTLGPNDSLVLFYAGHGGTRAHQVGSQVVKSGYLIPVDASERAATWIDLDGWLRAVALLPAKHILVILDACHSGIALGPIIKWRDTGTWQDTPLSTLKARRSRRIITSALDDQVALDTGPIHGHSLFTGCLIEGLSHGLWRAGRRVTTGSELGLYLQRRVETYPGSRQTPDFGTFDFDERGELVIPLTLERCEDSMSPGGLSIDNSRELAGSMAVPDKLGVGVGGGIVTMGPLGIVGMGTGLPREAVGARSWRRSVFAGSTSVVLALVAYSISSNGQVSPPVRVLSAASQPSGSKGMGCPGGMVRVPGSTFWMGSPEGEGAAAEHPRREVTLSEYCIDETEVTVNAYSACVRAKGCSPAFQTVEWSGYSSEDVEKYSQWCNGADPLHPMNCVGWDQARAYCQWAGKRLPTEAEWEYAARGNDRRVFPWGDAPPNATLLNACGAECQIMAKRVMKLGLGTMYEASDRWVTTAPVGSFQEGASPFGAFDMAGNVWEWTADLYGPYSEAAATNPRGAITGPARVIRGGGWSNSDPRVVRVAHREWDHPWTRRSALGFRCAFSK